MNWLAALALIGKLIGLLADLARWIERERIKDEAQREQARVALEKIDAEVAKADAARERVRAELDADPGRLRPSGDSFRRPD